MIFKGENCADTMKSIFQHTCEWICFKLWMMLSKTKCYSLIPVWMTLMFRQGHRIMRKLELVMSLCCKVAWSNSKVHKGWLCKGDGCEEVLWVWWIWIVWTFVLLVCLQARRFVPNWMKAWLSCIWIWMEVLHMLHGFFLGGYLCQAFG